MTSLITAVWQFVSSPFNHVREEIDEARIDNDLYIAADSTFNTTYISQLTYIVHFIVFSTVVSIWTKISRFINSVQQINYRQLFINDFLNYSYHENNSGLESYPDSDPDSDTDSESDSDYDSDYQRRASSSRTSGLYTIRGSTSSYPTPKAPGPKLSSIYWSNRTVARSNQPIWWHTYIVTSRDHDIAVTAINIDVDLQQYLCVKPGDYLLRIRKLFQDQFVVMIGLKEPWSKMVRHIVHTALTNQHGAAWSCEFVMADMGPMSFTETETLKQCRYGMTNIQSGLVG